MILIDTNVLVYGIDERDASKHVLAGLTLERMLKSRVAVISSQVAAEFTWTLSRIAGDVGARATIASQARGIVEEWPMLPVDAAVVTSALFYWERYSLSYWDAQLLATAVVGGCDTILTEDVPAPELAGVSYVNPFAEDFDLDALVG